jgi:competence protein ComEC
MQTPDGRTILYDAGAMGSPEYATQSISAYLWNRGIMRIDGIVLSHADTDHYNAVPGLIERFRVAAVYVSPVMFSSIGDEAKVGGVKVLHDAIVHARVPIHEIWAGDTLRVGCDLTLRVLHPPKHGVIGSDNANSVVVGAEYARRRLLLPGDLESPGLNDLIAEEPYDCDILLAPHHGSRRSDPPGFAAWSRPEWVVVSNGGNDDIGPVVRTYTRAGGRVLATSQSGTIEFNIRPGGDLWPKTWLSTGVLADAKPGRK